MKVKLKDICEINPKDSAPAGDLMVSFIPMSRVSDEGEIDVSETRPAKEVLKGFSSFKDGDVLMAKITPCMENGKGCIARNLSNGLGYGSTEFHVIRPISNRVRREWIYYFIMHKRFRQKCIPHMTGSAGQKRVPKNYLLSCEIPLPTISIQDYIIRTLTNLRSIIHLRQSQLSKLDELVKCRFVELFGNQNDSRCTFKPLAEVCSFQQGTQVPIEEQLVVFQEGYLRFLRIIDYTQAPQPPRYVPAAGKIINEKSVVVVRYGTVGFVGRGYAGVLANNLFEVIPQNNILNHDFLYLALKYGNFEQEMQVKAKGAALKALSFEMMKDIYIAVPSMQKQCNFVKFFEQIDKSRFVDSVYLTNIHISTAGLGGYSRARCG